MKSIVYVMSIILLVLQPLKAELINVNPDPNGNPWILGGIEWSAEEMEWYNSLPFFTPTPLSNPVNLPSVVDNSTTPFFRSIFDQGAFFSCAQAATIGYAFTYEINRKLNRSARDQYGIDIEANEFPTHYTYNFWNGGGNTSTPISGAVGTAKEFGVPNCSVWREVTKEAVGTGCSSEDPMIGTVVQWMNGYSRYYNALQNRILGSEQFGGMGAEENLVKLKQFLYDYGNGERDGGVAVFTINLTDSTTEYALYPQDSPEAGKALIKNVIGEPNHAMTIVGYNDSVKFDFNNDGRYTKDEDINGDDQVNMVDWEFGALKIANSYGTTWPYITNGDGFCYLPYKLLGERRIEQVQRLIVEKNHVPELAYKVAISHNNRKLVRCNYGISNDPYNSNLPVPFPSLDSFRRKSNFLEVAYPMQGAFYDPMEFAIDLSDYINENLQDSKPLKFYFRVEEEFDSVYYQNLYDGVLNSFSLIDYRNDNELHIKYSDYPTPIGRGQELTMLYDVLPVAIEIDMLIPQTFNIGIPQSSTISGISTFIPGRGVRFFMHNTDLSITDGSVVNLGNRTIFNGFDANSQDRIMNYSEIDMQSYGVMELNNLDLCLFNGSSTKIQRIELSGESSIQIEDGSFIEFNDNSYLSAEGNAIINGDIATTNLATFELKENSTLNLVTFTDLIIASGTTLKLQPNTRLIVENGANLIIQDGAIVELGDGAQIVIKNKGYLTATSSLLGLINFNIQSTDISTKEGIVCEVGSTLDLNKVKVNGTNLVVEGLPKYCKISYCKFENCGLSLTNCYNYIIENNVFTGNGTGNGATLTLVSATGTFKNNDIRGYDKGVVVTSCSPKLTRNTIINNIHYGLYATGYNAYPLLVDPTILGLNNEISNNGLGTDPEESAQIYIKYNASVYLANGKNNIYSIPTTQVPEVPCIKGVDWLTASKAIYPDKVVIEALNNYWGFPSIYPETFEYYFDLYERYIIFCDDDKEDPFVIDITYPAGNNNLSVSGILLAQALEFELDGKLDIAIKKYEKLIEKYPDTTEYFVALVRLPDVYATAELALESLISIYDKKLANPETSNKKFYKEMLVYTNIKMKKYDTAISLAEEMRAEAQTEGEVQLADIDITVAKLMKESETQGKSSKNNNGNGLTELISQLTDSDLNQDQSNPSDIFNKTILPKENTLYQNYPNPFNPITEIKYDLSRTADVKLSIYNISGQLVAELENGVMNAGSHAVDFDGSKLNSGVYYFTLKVDGKSLTKKMIFMK